MPNCFSLTSKDGTEPAKYQTIDDLMRSAFDEPPDDFAWLYGWYDTIGLMLAMGRTWDDIREVVAYSPELLRCVTWLEARYTPEAWYSTH